MIGLAGRHLVFRAIEAVAGVLGLPSSRVLIALTTLTACAAVYSRRLALAVGMIGLTGLIALAAFVLHAVAGSADSVDRGPAHVVEQPVSQGVALPPR